MIHTDHCVTDDRIWSIITKQRIACPDHGYHLVRPLDPPRNQAESGVAIVVDSFVDKVI